MAQQQHGLGGGICGSARSATVRVGRLVAVQHALAPTATPAAGLLSQLAQLFCTSRRQQSTTDLDIADAAAVPTKAPHVPVVVGTVRACFMRPSAEERAAAIHGGEPAAGRFARVPVASLALSSDHDSPDLHPFARPAAPIPGGGPPERGVLCQTAEAYEKVCGAGAVFISTVSDTQWTRHRDVCADCAQNISH